MIKTNFHTHTELCTHATGSVNDYILEAVNNEFQEIGISDHGPLVCPPFPRMDINQFFTVYMKDINEAKKKYNGLIKIYAGIEIEYVRNDIEYLKSLASHLDYMILGPHYYSKKAEPETSTFRCDNKKKLKEYTELIEEALDTKLFKILAHPDLFMTAYKELDLFAVRCVRRIIKAAMKNDVLLELNANGIRREDHKGYPNEQFFKIVKEMNAKVIIGSDAHNPKEINDQALADAYKMAKDLGLDVVKNLDGEPYVFEEEVEPVVEEVKVEVPMVVEPKDEPIFEPDPEPVVETKVEPESNDEVKMDNPSSDESQVVKIQEEQKEEN